MKIWPVLVRIPIFGICEVIEMTDRETTRGNRKGLNYAPRSMGFVNLFLNGAFTGWCGIAYAKKRIIHRNTKLPKYIRDIPI